MKPDKNPILEANFPLDYRTDIVSKIFENIKKAESFSFIGVKDNCKVNVLRFFSYRQDVQEKYLGAQANNYVYIMVDLNELAEVSLLGFYHLFGSSLVESIRKPVTSLKYLNQLFIDNPTLVIKALKEDLVNLVNQTGKQIIIIFNNFDLLRKLDLNLIYHQLIALRNSARFRITYIFTGTRSFEPNTLFFRKFVYMTPFCGKDALGVVERNCARYQVELSEDQANKVIELSGGHAGMIKFIVQSCVGLEKGKIDSTLKNIYKNPDVCFQCERILEPLTELEKTKLKAGEKEEMLINLGLQVPTENSLQTYRVFSPILQDHLNEKVDSLNPLVIDIENDEIYLWGKTLKKQLSEKEFGLLSLLLNNPQDVMSRERIMNELWGEEEFPSDWAFDKLISRLREKLGDSSKDQRLIKTFRNKGVSINPKSN